MQNERRLSGRWPIWCAHPYLLYTGVSRGSSTRTAALGGIRGCVKVGSPLDCDEHSLRVSTPAASDAPRHREDLNGDTKSFFDSSRIVLGSALPPCLRWI